MSENPTFSGPAPDSAAAGTTIATGGDIGWQDVLHQLHGLDLAVYRAVEQSSTPAIDRTLRRISRLANYSQLWIAVAALLFAFGGRSGRRAAVTGLAAIGLNSFLVNIPLKSIARRRRPERAEAPDGNVRHVPMPTSRSFPSGHSASAFAFATAVSAFRPELGWGLRAAAALVAYSRVHCGVHYPGDVLVGSLIGIGVGESTALASRALLRQRA
jgi:undecaprenyl-diphosphatase